MQVETGPNPYSAPLSPIPVDPSGFPWGRLRIVPMAVCWLTGGLMIVLSTFAAGPILFSLFGPANNPLVGLVCCLMFGGCGLALMYSALLWKRGRWLFAMGVTGAAGSVLVLGLFVISSLFSNS
jgi:hypothetical protein